MQSMIELMYPPKAADDRLSISLLQAVLDLDSLDNFFIYCASSLATPPYPSTIWYDRSEC